ncbi:unnamed protein product [Brugia pahangi]|uniref:Ovule protein n=1 Tax=Brugia pahangi TaxID=6280 RepID=A0A0N4T044_BRUPA|nr:unnamed protein product [Brugia pahangi]
MYFDNLNIVRVHICLTYSKRYSSNTNSCLGVVEVSEAVSLFDCQSGMKTDVRKCCASYYSCGRFVSFLFLLDTAL